MRNLRGEAIRVVAGEIQKLLADNIEPCLSSDLWSENGVSLLGQILHFINDDFEPCELLVRATPISNVAHDHANVRILSVTMCSFIRMVVV